MNTFLSILLFVLCYFQLANGDKVPNSISISSLPSGTPPFSFVRDFIDEPNQLKVWNTDDIPPPPLRKTSPRSPPSNTPPFSFVRDFIDEPNQLKVWNTDDIPPPSLRKAPSRSPPSIRPTFSFKSPSRSPPSSKVPTKDTSILPSSHLFIRHENLHAGFKVQIYFGGSYPNSTHVPDFLPPQYSIPFSTKKLPSVLKFFGFNRTSRQAIAMKITVKSCEDVENFKAIGLFKRCATSYKHMKALVESEFGNKTPLAVRTSPLPKSAKIFQNYTILGISQIPAQDMVGCHLLMYPYAIYYCHHPQPINLVYQSSLQGEDGTLVKSVVSCHMNTVNFNPNLMGFKMLGLAPGSPICHFLPAEDYIWVPSV